MCLPDIWKLYTSYEVSQGVKVGPFWVLLIIQNIPFCALNMPISDTKLVTINIGVSTEGFSKIGSPTFQAYCLGLLQFQSVFFFKSFQSTPILAKFIVFHFFFNFLLVKHCTPTPIDYYHKLNIDLENSYYSKVQFKVENPFFLWNDEEWRVGEL